MIVVVYCNSISNFEGKKAKEKREHTWHKTHCVSSPTGLSLTPCSFGGGNSLKLHVGGRCDMAGCLCQLFIIIHIAGSSIISKISI